MQQNLCACIITSVGKLMSHALLDGMCDKSSEHCVCEWFKPTNTCWWPCLKFQEFLNPQAGLYHLKGVSINYRIIWLLMHLHTVIRQCL
jgi:hypothetical protein